jgi:Raf kinase inhibitor-like YbhB/YbcL family protein
MISIPPFLRKIFGADGTPVPAKTKDPLAGQIPAMRSRIQFGVFSNAFKDGESIPLKYSAYGENLSPQLSWEIGPGSTQSYAVFMEDPDAVIGPRPVVHWLAWNISADQLSLPEGLPPEAELRSPRRMRQGLNANGTLGYAGPHPAGGESSHHYGFQVFALDSMLNLPGGAARHDLLEACVGHVIGAGVLLGKFIWPNPE